MTIAARRVLYDLQYAIHNHNEKLQSEAFRVSWFSIVALLRSVGHVLDKVDSHQSIEMKSAISKIWKKIQETKPEPTIFWGFINSERNRFLKEYQHSIDRTVDLYHMDGHYLCTEDVGNTQGYAALNTPVYSRISSGVFEGQNEIEVAWEAWHWWSSYLDEVDALVCKGSGNAI